MTFPLVTTTLAVLAVLLVLRFLGGGRRTLTTGDIGLVLAAAEVAQLTQVLIGLDVELGLPAGSWVTIGMFALGLAAAGVWFDGVGKIVTGVGVVAALAETLLEDGPGPAVGLLSLIILVWIVIRLVRMLRPW